nr:hypothetical protein Ccrd_022478 [Ipomoea trifida]
MAGPMRSRSNARFIPHMGNRVPFGIVMIASTPGVPLQRLDELRGRIIIRNVEPETVRHGGRNPLPETERVAAYEIRALPVRLVQSVEEKRRRWAEQILNVLFKRINILPIIINGEDVLLFGDHVAEATASGILKGYARGPRAHSRNQGDFNGPGRIAVLDDDEMVGLEKRPPHFEEIEVSDRRNHDVQIIFQLSGGSGHGCREIKILLSLCR